MAEKNYDNIYGKGVIEYYGYEDIKLLEDLTLKGNDIQIGLISLKPIENNIVDKIIDLNTEIKNQLTQEGRLDIDGRIDNKRFLEKYWRLYRGGIVIISIFFLKLDKKEDIEDYTFENLKNILLRYLAQNGSMGHFIGETFDKINLIHSILNK